MRRLRVLLTGGCIIGELAEGTIENVEGVL
jgi:hypothetical protein